MEMQIGFLMKMKKINLGRGELYHGDNMVLGMEIDSEYIEIAKARIEATEPTLF